MSTFRPTKIRFSANFPTQKISRKPKRAVNEPNDGANDTKFPEKSIRDAFAPRIVRREIRCHNWRLCLVCSMRRTAFAPCGITFFTVCTVPATATAASVTTVTLPSVGHRACQNLCVVPGFLRGVRMSFPSFGILRAVRGRGTGVSGGAGIAFAATA